MNFKKKNNSNNGELQPYNPKNGEYCEDNISNIYNYYARKLGGEKDEFPLGFPSINYPIEYIHDYFNNEIDWSNVEIKDNKIEFLIDIAHPKKRYLIFRKLLGYNEENWQLLKEEICKNAMNYKVFVDKGYDEWGFRVKIYMPVKFANSDKQLIIKTCWLISKEKRPKFITAWYDSNFERNLRDEI